MTKIKLVCIIIKLLFFCFTWLHSYWRKKRASFCVSSRILQLGKRWTELIVAPLARRSRRKQTAATTVDGCTDRASKKITTGLSRPFAQEEMKTAVKGDVAQTIPSCDKIMASLRLKMTTTTKWYQKYITELLRAWQTYVCVYACVYRSVYPTCRVKQVCNFTRIQYAIETRENRAYGDKENVIYCAPW